MASMIPQLIVPEFIFITPINVKYTTIYTAILMIVYEILISKTFLSVPCTIKGPAVRDILFCYLLWSTKQWFIYCEYDRIPYS